MNSKLRIPLCWKVKGIGEKSFLKLKPLVTVAPEKGERAGGAD